MTKGIQLAIWRQPEPLVVGVGSLLVLAGVWFGLVFPLQPYSADLQRDLALLILRVLQLALCVTLLQIALGFVVAGKNASVEIRCRTCTFSTVAVVVMLIGVSMVVVWHPITYDDLRWDMYGERSWHEARHGFLLCAVPLLTGVCVHSGLYTALDLRRLEPTVRNRIAAYLIIATVALGSSGAGVVVSLCARVQMRETADFRDAYVALWQATDRMTERFLEESPGDYHFYLLRANFLADAGRTNEARILYQRVCAATNVPGDIREHIRTLGDADTF